MTSGIPETRFSLLLRVRDPEDGQAWNEFLEIYRPAVYRYARRRGLQPADADDLAQQVFVKAAQKLPEWNADPDRGSFRAWLLTVARHALINHARRKPAATAQGGSGVTLQLLSVQDESQERGELEYELKRAAFRRAAADVKPEFQEATWSAFWLTAVEQQTVEQVAARLNMSMGAVYTARSRIMKRLREVARSIDLEA